MWIIYSDGIGVVTERIDIDFYISVLDGFVYYATKDGTNKCIPVDSLRGLSRIKPF